MDIIGLKCELKIVIVRLSLLGYFFMRKLDLKYEKKYVEIVKDIILKELRKYQCKVLLFGSRAVGDIHWASDIDIGIEMLNMEKFKEIKKKIYERLEYCDASAPKWLQITIGYKYPRIQGA